MRYIMWIHTRTHLNIHVPGAVLVDEHILKGLMERQSQLLLFLPTSAPLTSTCKPPPPSSLFLATLQQCPYERLSVRPHLMHEQCTQDEGNLCFHSGYNHVCSIISYQGWFFISNVPVNTCLSVKWLYFPLWFTECSRQSDVTAVCRI